MVPKNKQPPDFFDHNPLDPVTAATGRQSDCEAVRSKRSVPEEQKIKVGGKKKKAGFYLNVDILYRFNRKFHELNLAGISIENKSALLETALTFALDDLDKHDDSRLLRQLLPAQNDRP